VGYLEEKERGAGGIRGSQRREKKGSEWKKMIIQRRNKEESKRKKRIIQRR